MIRETTISVHIVLVSVHLLSRICIPSVSVFTIIFSAWSITLPFLSLSLAFLTLSWLVVFWFFCELLYGATLSVRMTLSDMSVQVVSIQLLINIQMTSHGYRSTVPSSVQMSPSEECTVDVVGLSGCSANCHAFSLFASRGNWFIKGEPSGRQDWVIAIVLLCLA